MSSFWTGLLSAWNAISCNVFFTITGRHLSIFVPQLRLLTDIVNFKGFYLLRYLLHIGVYSHPLSNQLQATLELAAVRCSLQGPKGVFKSAFYSQLMTPIDVILSPYVTKVRHGSTCKISPMYVAPFRRSQTDLYDDSHLFIRLLMRWIKHV